MKTCINKLDEIFTTITYAEENAYQEPMYILKKHGMWDYSEMLNALFAAGAFAEAGEFDTAIEILKGYLEKTNKYKSDIFQRGIQICCCAGK